MCSSTNDGLHVIENAMGYFKSPHKNIDRISEATTSMYHTVLANPFGYDKDVPIQKFPVDVLRHCVFFSLRSNKIRSFATVLT